MDTENLDGYFTNLIFEIEASRNRRAGDREIAYLDPQPRRDRRLLPWLAGFAAVWFGAVTLGLWL